MAPPLLIGISGPELDENFGGMRDVSPWLRRISPQRAGAEDDRPVRSFSGQGVFVEVNVFESGSYLRQGHTVNLGYTRFADRQ